MNLKDLPLPLLRQRMRRDGLVLAIGPFVFRLGSPLPGVAEGLALLYANHPVLDEDCFADYAVHIGPGRGVRRWWRPQALFRFDGGEPFKPLPRSHALPLMEWAMNWCVAMHAHQFLLLHAAVLERQGHAVLLPAPPGSGKSTLCAALMHRGWRLLSDEMALIRLDGDAAIVPFGRPVSLKNASIDLIRAWAPQSVFSPVVHDTAKGSVAHLRVPPEQLDRVQVAARPRWVVFPRYEPGAPPTWARHDRADGMIELGRNAFNYMVLGQRGFDALARVVDACSFHDFTYSHLDDAVTAFDRLCEGSLQDELLGQGVP